MKYRRLGRTGLSVSVIGLGTWQLGGEWGLGALYRTALAYRKFAGEVASAPLPPGGSQR